MYSGLWSCDLVDNRCKWKCIRGDHLDAKGTPSIRSRIGHCMVFDPDTRCLHILHGQRLKDYLRYDYALTII